MQVADEPKVVVTQRWCWIGNHDSAYLDKLTNELADLRPRLGENSTIEVSLIHVESSAKLHKIIAKTRADFFVWSIPEEGIADRLMEVNACRQLHWNSRHIAAGIASPSERRLMMEAGCCWHVEQPHQWRTCLLAFCGT